MPAPALTLTSPDLDADTCLNLAMLTTAALLFAQARFSDFQLACVETSPSADLTEFLLTVRAGQLGEIAELLANGVIAAGGAT